MNLILDFTRVCNSKCTSCSIWKIENPITLEIEYIEKLISQMPVDYIYVTGGEPYICKEIVDIAKIVKHYHPNAIWSGATNGISPNTISVLDQIIGLGLRVHVEISLEGNEEQHDTARGVPGNHARILKLIGELRTRGVGCSISTISNNGAIEAQRLGISFKQNMPRSGSRYNTEGNNPKGLITNCEGAYRVIVCTPNGDIYPCEEYLPELLLGNIKECDLKDMRFQEVRDYIISKRCQPCGMSCWFDR